jgi:hypothetical protein
VDRSRYELYLSRAAASSRAKNRDIPPQPDAGWLFIFGLELSALGRYGPEAALTRLIPLGLAGIQHIVPMSFTIIGLLAIVCVSYLQTIDACRGHFSLSLAKAVADMALRQDVSGMCRVIFDFLSKLVDKDAQIFAFITILRPPNGG